MSVAVSKVMEIAKETQVNIAIDEDLKNEMKLWAVKHGRTMKGMLTEYIKQGFEKEKSKTE